MARKKKNWVGRQLDTVRTIDFDRYFALGAGVGISGISAWFSVLGLAAIFSGSPLTIMLMGGALEIGKIITASYLYRNWKTLPWLIKMYFTIAVVVLMGITSMGTFGYLSKAHIQQSYTSDTVQVRIDHINEQIRSDREVKTHAQVALQQLDAAVNRMIEQGRVQTALLARADQAQDRQVINNQITTADEHIQQLLNQRVPLDQQASQAARDVGPIKYVAELVYGSDRRDVLEKAVRWMIILLVIVFDPLAVLLIMTSTQYRNKIESDEVVRKTKTKYDKEASEWLNKHTRSNANAVSVKDNWKPMNVSVSTPNDDDELPTLSRLR